MILIRYVVVAVSVLIALVGATAQPTATGIALINKLVADTACVRVHNLWRLQLAALEQTQGRSANERTEVMLANVYRPYSVFWAGYVGDEATFAQWVRERFRLDGDPRRGIPLALEPESTIVKASLRLAAFAERPTPCSDWYVVFGPGWTNLGGLPRIGMVVDFLGMPRVDGIRDFRTYLPHEIAHLLIGPAHAGDPDAGTLLNRIIDEGFASYVSRIYWGSEMTSAQALGYTQSEWAWALAHEGELWASASSQLRTHDRAIIERFRAANARMFAGGPGKIGYFLGYRIAEAYVARHGAESWRDLFALPYERTLRESEYQGGRTRSP